MHLDYILRCRIRTIVTSVNRALGSSERISHESMTLLGTLYLIIPPPFYIPVLYFLLLRGHSPH
jgi:hypothetical protein